MSANAAMSLDRYGASLQQGQTPAAAPGPDAARLMQELAWATVTAYPRSGVAG